MIPVIALVGRPNVGKSTLFNCMTKTRDALVADLPGVTRDRKYGEGQFDDTRYIVIDTGGIEADSRSDIFDLMESQSTQAIAEADAVLFVVDAKEGLTPSDYKIAQKVRQTTKPIFLVVNKSESMESDIATADFYQLGFDKVFATASAHNRGVTKLIESVLSEFPTTEQPTIPEAEGTIKIAFIGRPNVGKSTLVNRILGEERVLVYDAPGTTRDSIFIPFQRQNQNYLLIDTAGIRRKARINEAIEKFSVIKSLQSIEAAHVVIFVLDAREGISDQDMRLLDFVVEAGKALVVAVNKWDGLSTDDRTKVRNEIDQKLDFVSFAKKYFISALHGTGVGDLYSAIHIAYKSAMKAITTPTLTRMLEAAVTQHQPPLVHGRRIKLRYAHLGGHNPPIIVIHGNQTESVPKDYLRYLNNFFLKKLKLVGTPLRIQLKGGENPYKDRKNVLTSRQKAKKQRLMRYVKKSKK